MREASSLLVKNYSIITYKNIIVLYICVSDCDSQYLDKTLPRAITHLENVLHEQQQSERTFET